MKTEIFKSKVHPVRVPAILWRLAEEGRLRRSMSGRAAYIKFSLMEQAKRDGFWDKYKIIMDKHT